MPEDLDFEISLSTRPHRAYGMLFVLQLVDLDEPPTDGEWWAQSESERGDDKLQGERTIDTARPHAHATIAREVVKLLRARLREMSIPALPIGWSGFGGTMVELRARDGFTSVSFAWLGEIPKEWASLAPIVAFLQDPTHTDLR